MAAADEGRRGFGRETKGPRFLLLRSPLMTAGHLPRRDNRPLRPLSRPSAHSRESVGGARRVTSDPECDGFGLGRVITFFAVTGIIVGTSVTFLDAEAVRPGTQGNPPNRSQTLAHPKGDRH